MDALPKVCVVGAGSSGLPVVKALKERGIPVTCLEKTANIGGLWCIDNKRSGATAAYDSLHINTDTRMMEYRDYPMPDGHPRLSEPYADPSLLLRLRATLRPVSAYPV